MMDKKEGYSSEDAGLIDVITIVNLEDMLELLEDKQSEAPYDTGVDEEENALDIAALKRVIALWI